MTFNAFKLRFSALLGREFLSKHVALKVAHSGHLNILFFLTCTDFIGSCGGELLDITHTNKLIIY